MEFWQKARTFAEEAAKRSHEFTMGSSKISDLVSETSRRSIEIAAEASKRAVLFKLEALRGADQLKCLADHLPLADSSPAPPRQADLETFGVTDDLREFVKGIHYSTFRDFPLQDDSEVSDVPTVSNVQQDLTEWQERHASLVLSTIKEISKLRYELCPRVMKERRFWRIYFILVNSYVAPYQKQYIEEVKLKSVEQSKDGEGKEPSKAATTSKPEPKEVEQQIKTSTSSTEQDLDVFLLEDLGDSDGGPDDGDGGFDDDFDRMDGSEGKRN